MPLTNTEIFEKIADALGILGEVLNFPPMTTRIYSSNYAGGCFEQGEYKLTCRVDDTGLVEMESDMLFIQQSIHFPEIIMKFKDERYGVQSSYDELRLFNGFIVAIRPYFDQNSPINDNKLFLSSPSVLILRKGNEQMEKELALHGYKVMEVAYVKQTDKMGDYTVLAASIDGKKILFTREISGKVLSINTIPRDPEWEPTPGQREMFMKWICIAHPDKEFEDTPLVEFKYDNAPAKKINVQNN